MWIAALWMSMGPAVAGGTEMKCKHGYTGRTILRWQSVEALEAYERERARRELRAVDRTAIPDGGQLEVEIHRRPTEHAKTEHFHWEVHVDGAAVITGPLDHDEPRRPPPPVTSDKAWWTRARLSLPSDMPQVFEVFVIDDLLGFSCGALVKADRASLKKRKVR
jgi:hypothetical protein